MLHSRRALRRRRLGLALAGGGPGGAVYEIGALKALEDSLEGLDLTTMDSYVGVSAGSVIAACLANGITTREMVRGIVPIGDGAHPFEPETFFQPAYGEWIRRGAKVPGLIFESLRDVIVRPHEVKFSDSITRLMGAVPVGLFNNEPIRRYFQHLFSLNDYTDDFRRLPRALTIVAADLESGKSVRFGRGGWDEIPISTAIQASTAVPGIYPPVKIDGRYCVDGVLLKTVHASVALEQGAELLIAVNPIVPVDTTPAVLRGDLGPGALVDGGLPTVLSQTFRTLVHSRMQIGWGAYSARFPNADVLLFEPGHDEYEMFFSNIFSFASRCTVCELGFDATRRDLVERREKIEPVLRKHGITYRDEHLLDGARDLWRTVGATPPHDLQGGVERLNRSVERLGEAMRR